MTEHVSRITADPTTTVGVRVPADLDQLLMLRALTETVSLIADFALDEVTDIRLALDEVATSLILDAVPGSELTCDFSYGDNRMTVAVSSVAATESVGEKHSFGWHIVRTLTESISTEQRPFDQNAGGYPTTARFTWVRGGSDGG
ncbi:ATP-binding protein [Nocardia cyriacigeorgica]|uniref:ATP-binding protein n=1 Tax=Nocardia cyriacigeorgica TaxID=135487 RepID=A0A5R8P8J4_9NOCA|nr:ATP-binding protein [Nocardia cyriacigeorgica]TLG00242.1 ATP-binding protein [Nocardia cyriacigeorgica]